MAQVTLNLSNVSLSSSYDHWWYEETSGVFAGSLFDRFTVATTDVSSPQSITVPSYSKINSVRLFCTYNSPAHAFAIRQLTVDGDAAHSGYFTNGMYLTKSLFTPGTHAIRLRFKSGTYATNKQWGSPWGATTNTGTLSVTGISLVIDYEPGEGGGSASSSAVKSGLSLNKATVKCGDLLRFNILNPSAGVYHKARVGISGVTYVDQIVPQGASYFDYDVPTGWQQYIPVDGTTRAAYARLFTYRDAARTDQIGYSDVAVTLTLSDDNVPTIVDFFVNLVPGHEDGDLDFFVQGFSGAHLSATAEAQYGATISQYRYQIGSWVTTEGESAVTPVLTTPGIKTVTLTVTDSRGRTASQTQDFTVVPYAPPALNTPTVRRDNGTGTAAHDGTYIYILSGIIISSLEELNEATLQARVYLKGSTPPAWTDPAVVPLTPETPVLVSGANVANSYTVDIRVTDKLGTYTYTTTIGTAKALLAGLANAAGAAVGKWPEEEDLFDVGYSRAKVSGDPVATYRVGSIYFTFEADDPNTLFPGTTWTKLGAGTFLAAAGTGYAAGSTGGEATHTLTAAEMPRHRHAVAAKSGASGLGAWGTVAYPSNSGTDATINTDYTGSDGAHENRPPYIAIYIWRRTA